MIRKKLKDAVKRSIRLVYWKYAYDEADHDQRYMLAHIPRDADHDVIIAKLEPILRERGVRATSYVRYTKENKEGGA